MLLCTRLSSLAFGTLSLFFLGAGFAACGSNTGFAPGPQDDAATDEPEGGAPDGGRADGGATGDAGKPPNDAEGCTVVKKGTEGLRLRGTMILPEGDPRVSDLAVDKNGTITCVAENCDAGPNATVIECGTGVITPGLINAHDHTDYNIKGPYPVGQERWTWRNGWRTGALGEKKLPSMPKVKTAAESVISELRFVMSGVVSVVGSGGVDGLARNLAQFPKNKDSEDLKGKTAIFDTFPLKDQSGKVTPAACDSTKVVTAASAFRGGAYVPHVSEGTAAAANQEFACLSQQSVGVINDRTAMIHSIGFTAEDAAITATAKAKVIWSPRSNVALYGNTAPIPLFKASKVTVAIGTDWLPSGSMNMLRELQCAASLNERYFGKALSDRDLFDIATKNGAEAAGFGKELGHLAVGFRADIAIFEGKARPGFRAVLDGSVEDVRLVMRGGKAVYGDSSLIDAFATDCAETDVCGQKRKVCLTGVEGNVAWDAIVASVAGGNYPLYFCRGETPKDEPSCVPYRDTYPNGTSATDRDGDGILDADDNCPGVFNPVRPMDGGKQADGDGDSFGDVCDAQPLNKDAH
jgi:large repetitive protein